MALTLPAVIRIFFAIPLLCLSGGRLLVGGGHRIRRRAEDELPLGGDVLPALKEVSARDAEAVHAQVADGAVILPRQPPDIADLDARERLEIRAAELDKEHLQAVSRLLCHVENSCLQLKEGFQMI